MSVYRTKLTKDSKQFNIVFRKNYKFMKRGNKTYSLFCELIEKENNPSK